MEHTLGKYHRPTGQITASFTHAGVTVERSFNACRKADGSHDRAASAQRADELARGIQRKIELGLYPAPGETPGLG